MSPTLLVFYLASQPTVQQVLPSCSLHISDTCLCPSLLGPCQTVCLTMTVYSLRHVQRVINSTLVLFYVSVQALIMPLLANVSVCLSVYDSVLCQLWCWLPATYCLLLRDTPPRVCAPVHCRPVLLQQHPLP